MSPAAPPLPRSPAAGRPRRTWDLVLTIVLLVALGGLSLLLSYFALFLGMMSDPCGGSVACDYGTLNAGVITALVAPLVVLVAALVAAIVLLRRRRLAFWVPLVAGPVVIGAWLVGAAIASSGVPT